MDYREAARQFCEEEGAFHLGVIPTEQPNPLTKTLSGEMEKDTKKGIQVLLSADQAVASRAREAFQSPQFEAMVRDILRVMETQDKRVVISSVGASGRLAIQLDAQWRRAWLDMIAVLPHRRQELMHLMDRVVSFTTGGDRALVRSVENFEDYQTFGARQVDEHHMGPGDVMLALSECSLSSSVIGSAKRADDVKSTCYYLYCNPKEVLTKHLQRAREVFAREDIVFIPLFVGPMAVSGSTRMQVTTVELLVAGAALEMAAARYCEKHFTADELSLLAPLALSGEAYANGFEHVVSSLSKGRALAGLAKAVELEAEIYQNGGLVTYLTHDYLLDVMTDTTERQPTFTLPPFRAKNDTTSPVSWAYVKDPLYPSSVAWEQLFLRPITGLEWTKEDYVAMGAAQGVVDNPPRLGRESVLDYDIGYDFDDSRISRHPNLLMLLDINGSAKGKARKWFLRHEHKFDQGAVLRMGRVPQRAISDQDILIPLELPETLMRVLSHLMVKLVMNTLSTATMAKIGRVWDNWMIQVLPTNKKLIDRSIRIIANLSGLPYREAAEAFFESYLGRKPEDMYRESFVVETLRRLGFEKNKAQEENK